MCETVEKILNVAIKLMYKRERDREEYNKCHVVSCRVTLLRSVWLVEDENNSSKVSKPKKYSIQLVGPKVASNFPSVHLVLVLVAVW